MTSEQYDSAIIQSFEQFPGIRDHFTAVTSGFARLLAPAYDSFARAFPDLRPIGPIYIVHSIGEFDGGTRKVSGQSRLVFGADVMAQVHHFADETPFFQHELFHVYHAQFFSDCEETWCALWSEGLAVLVAQRLNPRATDAELLLTSPQPIRPEVDRNRVAAVCAVASRRVCRRLTVPTTRLCFPMAHRSRICQRASGITLVISSQRKRQDPGLSPSSRIWITKMPVIW